MKSEAEIKSKIKELWDEGSLVSLIGALMLMWVLDIEIKTIQGYADKLGEALQGIAEFIEQL